MISVKETIRLDKRIVILICEMFDNKIVTDTISSNIGLFKDFEINNVKACFSIPTTRIITVFTKEDCSNMKSIDFI